MKKPWGIMKTEAEFPGITTMRLTGVTNAADDLLHLLGNDEIEIVSDDELAAGDILHVLKDQITLVAPPEWQERLAKAKSRLARAIEVARGADLPLHSHLFRYTADRSAVRLIEAVIGLEDESTS